MKGGCNNLSSRTAPGAPQTLHILAAGLRQLGHDTMAALPPPPLQPHRSADADAAGGAAQQEVQAVAAAAGHPQAAQALRCAAGVYAFLETHLASLDTGPAKRCLPPSLLAASMHMPDGPAVAVPTHVCHGATWAAVVERLRAAQAGRQRSRTWVCPREFLA